MRRRNYFPTGAGGKLHKQSVATVEEQPTAITKGSVGGERAEEATAETRPADVNRILEYEEAVREEQKKREQAEREQAEKEKLRKDEERRQAVEVRRRRIKACIPWMVKAAAVLVLGIGLYYGWRVWELLREKQHEQNYQAAMEAGQKAYGLKDYDTTIQQADVALANKSPDEAATRMKNAAQAHKTEIAERERKYQAAMEAGQKAYDLKDYDTAIEQADMALSNKSGDAAATKLKNAAQARKTEIAERDRKYQAAMEAGQKAYGLKDYDTTIQQADVALGNKSPDEAATKMKNDAQARKTEIAERERKYQAAMEAGQKAYGLKDYDTAIEQADVALGNKSPDKAATRMKNEAQARKTEIAERERKYQAAMEAGQKAYGLKDYDMVIEQADVALGNKFPDEAATKMKNEAQARKTEIAERERKYQAAMEAGQKAYGLKDYDTTIQQADVALGNNFPDEAAMRMKNEAQARKTEIAERERKYSGGDGGGPKRLTA